MANKPTTTERPPVIAIMGHIDHGKSTLLDYIRQTNIVAKEAGGITQHISAYEVVHQDKDGQNRKITFLDTPGHEAFSKMRARGAQVADIAILIVSAEEGVKPQTLEAHKSIIEAKIPFIVAINKIDKPNANVEKCKLALSEAGIYVEGYGGNIPFVPISAKSGQGIPELLDMMLLVAEMEQLSGDTSANGSGFVLEANLDPKIGTTATLIVKNGTIHTGDYIVVEGQLAKIKKIEDFLGKTIKEATFSSPIRVFGFCSLPVVGSSFDSFSDKKEAEKFTQLAQELSSSTNQHQTEGNKNDATIEIPLIVKADVAGTLEALDKEIAKLQTEKISLRIIQTGVGAISENDVKLASSSTNAIILGFHVKTDRAASDLAERYNIKIEIFDIIYKLSEWLMEEIKARTPKETIEEIIGRAKILKTFSRTKDKQIVGGQVTKGKILKGKEIKIIRREAEIGRGKIVDLQEQRIKTNQVEEGTQFGAEIDSKFELAEGDYLEAFELITK